MNNLLEVKRGEYRSAVWFFDVDRQMHVGVDSEVAEPRFQRFMQLQSFIQQSQMDVKMRYLQIGCALLEIDREKLYLYVAPKDKSVGYSTFYGFCQDVFGLKKSTAANMVAVAREFCGDDGGVKIPYLNFSFAQLVEMLPIEEKYRPRITTKCTTRDIRRLKAYYKDNVPKAGGTVEDDLTAWNEICKKEQERKNAKKNAITFIPAQKALPEPVKEKKVEKQKADDFDGEDERDIVTPTEKKISFDSVRNGLYRQLALVRKCFTESADGSAAVEKWDQFATLVETALRNRFPDYIVAYNSSSVQSSGEPAHGKLRFKNVKERKEWLENYKSWGVWLDVPEVAKKFYRYNFENGDSLVIEESLEYNRYYEVKCSSFVRYAIIDKDRKEYDSSYPGGASGIVEWLTKHAREI